MKSFPQEKYVNLGDFIKITETNDCVNNLIRAGFSGKIPVYVWLENFSIEEKPSGYSYEFSKTTTKKHLIDTDGNWIIKIPYPKDNTATMNVFYCPIGCHDDPPPSYSLEINKHYKVKNLIASKNGDEAIIRLVFENLSQFCLNGENWIYDKFLIEFNDYNFYESNYIYTSNGFEQLTTKDIFLIYKDGAVTVNELFTQKNGYRKRLLGKQLLTVKVSDLFILDKDKDYIAKNRKTQLLEKPCTSIDQLKNIEETTKSLINTVNSEKINGITHDLVTSTKECFKQNVILTKKNNQESKSALQRLIRIIYPDFKKNSKGGVDSEDIWHYLEKNKDLHKDIVEITKITLWDSSGAEILWESPNACKSIRMTKKAFYNLISKLNNSAE